MIECKNITKHFNEISVLKDISFTISKNQTLGVLGPNGAGKSTTLKIMATLLKPSSGKVLINGVDLVSGFNEIRSLISYLPESPPLYPELKISEYLEFFGRLRRPNLAKAELADEVFDKIKRCRLLEVQSKSCGVLSKGFRQKVGLAAALMGDPKILLLDEPTSGLDPREIVEIRALIKELKKSHTILFSSHILSEVSELCDEVVMFLGGRTVFQSSLAELANKGGLESSFLEALNNKNVDTKLKSEGLNV